MKIALFRCWCLMAIGAFSLCAPVSGQDTSDRLTKALDLVHQVESPTGIPPSDAQRIDLLSQAITLAQQAPNHRLKGHRVLAIQAIRSAIAEIRAGDPNQQVATFLQTADRELNTSVSLAGHANAPPAMPVNSPTPPPSPPPSAASVPTDTALPAGVTTEMEQNFLARFKAALEKQDPDAYTALFAADPAIDPKVKDEIQGLELFSLGLTLSNPNRTYAFVPLTPDEREKPEEFGGKMYGDYLPAVIGFRITFGKPDSAQAAQSASGQAVATGTSTERLCVQDHQLMLVGAKLIPGATPPPAQQSYNFGIKPNVRKVDDKADWENGNAFRSLDEFLSSLKQPSVEILASGEAKFEYYAICRISPNYCVYAGGDKVGQRNYGWYIKARGSDQQELKGSPKWIRLVDVPTDNGQAPNVQGTVFEVPEHYSGLVTVEAQYQDEAGKKADFVSQNIVWK